MGALFTGIAGGLGQAGRDMSKARQSARERFRQQQQQDFVNRLAMRQQDLAERREAFTERLSQQSQPLGQPWLGSDGKMYAWTKNPDGTIGIMAAPGKPVTEEERKFALFDDLKGKLGEAKAFEIIYGKTLPVSADDKEYQKFLGEYKAYKEIRKTDPSAIPWLFKRTKGSGGGAGAGAGAAGNSTIVDTYARELSEGARKLPTGASVKDSAFWAAVDKVARDKYHWKGGPAQSAAQINADKTKKAGLDSLEYTLGQLSNNINVLDSTTYRYKLEKLQDESTYAVTRQGILKTLNETEQDFKDAYEQARDDITTLRPYFGNQRASEAQFKRFAALLPGFNVASSREAKNKLAILQSLVTVIRQEVLGSAGRTTSVTDTVSSLRPYIVKQIGPNADPKGLEVEMEDGSTWNIMPGGRTTMIRPANPDSSPDPNEGPPAPETPAPDTEDQE